MSTDADIREFLDQVLQLHSNEVDPGRPHVTLTFAQSVDGKIAGVGGKQLILSGKESMVMTHRQTLTVFYSYLELAEYFLCKGCVPGTMQFL